MTPGIENVTLGISAAGSATGTVSAGMARGLVDFAASRGADRAALIAAAGLPAHALADDDSRLPFPRYVALYAAAADACDDPAFALHFGEWIEGMDLLVCHVGSAAGTMGGALETINRYNRLAVDLETVGGSDPFRLEPAAEGTWVIDSSIYPDGVPYLTETSFARLITGTRMLTERNFVRAVHLARTEPSYVEEYERVFRAPVMFLHSRNAMLVDPEWFSLQLPATARYADGVLEGHAERLMAELDPRRSCRRSVAELVAGRLAGGAVAMDAVAKDLGMSRATLYRALRSEGTTFEQIVDATRRELATRLLTEGRSIAETADRLGFSDRSAFSRAYKRWTGVSPGSVGWSSPGYGSTSRSRSTAAIARADRDPNGRRRDGY